MNAKTAAAPLRAAIYARQSVTDDEGIDRQRELCAKLAEVRGYEIVEVYADNNVSGYKPRGAGTDFDRMLADARAGRFDVLIIRKLDRLTRSLADLEALQGAKVKTVTTDGELDLASPSGRLVANVLTAVSRAESEIKAERRVFANTDRRQRASGGVPTSGRVPYGYVWVPTRDRGERGDAYRLDKKRAPIVRRIFDEFLAGVPLGGIARDLNADKHRTAPSKRHPEGVPFTPTTVRRVLLNPYYAAHMPAEPPKPGEHYDSSKLRRDDLRPGRWPAIVTIDEWAEVGERLRRPDRKTSPGPARKWLLSGLARCGVEITPGGPVCGQPIRAGGGEAGVHSYRCPSMRHFMRRGVPLDQYIEGRIIARLSDREAAARLLTTPERPDVDALRAQRRRLESGIESVLELVAEGATTKQAADGTLRRKRAEIAEIDAKLREGVDVDTLADVVGADDVAKAWAGLTLGKRREIVDALLDIEVLSVGQGNRRNMPPEAMAKTLRLNWKR